MTAECSNLDIEGLGTVQAHKGILQAAKYVQQKLQENHILDQAFERGPVSGKWPSFLAVNSPIYVV